LETDLNELYLAFTVNVINADSFWSTMLSFVTRCTHDDEDLGGIVMLKLIEALSDYRHQGKIESWVRRVIRNAKIDQCRRHSEDTMESDELERLQAAFPQEKPLLLDLSVIQDPLDRTLADFIVMHNDSLAIAAGKCNLSERGARKRLRRLGRKLGSPSTLIF
jgi:DNA-directed RNA polymerase specialized sigma24 family protein